MYHRAISLHGYENAANCVFCVRAQFRCEV